MIEIVALVVVAVWCAFPFTQATWQDLNFVFPKIPRRKQQFDILPFVLSFQLEMESGSSCRTAVTRALENVDSHHLQLTRKAIEKEDNVSQALLQDAHKYPELNSVAIAVGISEVSGARMGNTLRTLTHDVLSVRKEHHEIRSELSATKATITVLAALPLLGMGMGTAIGAAPLQWLATTSIGRVCLVGAIVLELLGTYWVARLVKRAKA